MNEDRQRALVPQDEANPERWRDLVERMLDDRAASPERRTSWGQDHPCPRCGSRNVARIAYGLPVGPEEEPDPEARELFHAGCVVRAARSRCNACEHAFPQADAGRLIESPPASLGESRGADE